MWNVNTVKVTNEDGTQFGINRNIVECKSSTMMIEQAMSVELIETLWNVNCRTLLNYNHGSGELIETLWNVNKHWFKGFLDSDADMN